MTESIPTSEDAGGERTSVLPRQLPPELSPRRSVRRRGGRGRHGGRPGSYGDSGGYLSYGRGAGPPPGVLPAPARPGGRRRGARRVLLVLVALVAALTLSYAGLAAYLVSSLDRTSALRDYAGRPAASPGETWLLVGSDSREGLTAQQRKQLHTGRVEGRRTDTVILLQVPRSGRPTLVSLPRDSYLPIPGHGAGKLNSAYAIGGPQLLARTVERASGLRVDHYMEVGFAGIVGVTDAVGGVRMCLPRTIRDAKSGLDVRRGCQVLDGAQALAYVRARYFDPRGDLGRIERQQQYLGAVMSAVGGPALLLNPVRLVRLGRAGTRAATVDDGSGPLDLLALGRAMRAVARGHGMATTVPIADPDYRVGGQSTVRWDDAGAGRLFGALRTGHADPARAGAAPAG